MDVEINESFRQRKKQKTRETIARVALELFAHNGYQRTTIPQIAEAADVSPRTVSTYFPAKEELVFEFSGDAKFRLADSVRDREPGTSTMDALRSWMLTEREAWLQDQDVLISQRQVIDSDEGLQAHERAMFAEFEMILAEGLAVDLEKQPDDLEPRMAAAAAFAVFGMLSAERDSGEIKMAPIDEQLSILDQALTFITAGINALR